MADYIEREEAILAVDERIKQIGYEGSPLVLSIRQSIRDVPSADVAPVKHGRWIDGDYRCVTAVCSKCKHLRLGNGAKFATRIALYCEHCGARMDGES